MIAVVTVGVRLAVSFSLATVRGAQGIDRGCRGGAIATQQYARESRSRQRYGVLQSPPRVAVLVTAYMLAF